MMQSAQARLDVAYNRYVENINTEPSVQKFAAIAEYTAAQSNYMKTQSDIIGASVGSVWTQKAATAERELAFSQQTGMTPQQARESQQQQESAALLSSRQQAEMQRTGLSLSDITSPGYHPGKTADVGKFGASPMTNPFTVGDAAWYQREAQIRGETGVTADVANRMAITNYYTNQYAGTPTLIQQEAKQPSAQFVQAESKYQTIGLRDAAGNLTGVYASNIYNPTELAKYGYKLVEPEKGISGNGITPSATGGSAYQQAMEAYRTGTFVDQRVREKAAEQGAPSAIISAITPRDRSGAIISERSTVPERDYSSGMGGKNVPWDYTPSGNMTFLPIGEKAQQVRTDTKIRYSPGGAFDVTQLVPSTTEGFTRIFPMITAGGSDYTLQSGMVSGKALTPIVYSQYGLEPMWSKDQENIVQSILKYPEAYSNLGSELYGGRVTPLVEGKTLQGEFLKGNTIMPGRYAPETMNYALLPGLVSANTPKEFTGTEKLPTGASLTFASDPTFQLVNAKTGVLSGVFPDWSAVKQTVIPPEEPPTILVRPEPVRRETVPAEFRGIDAITGEQFDTRIISNPKYASQFGGSLIGNAAWNATKEVEENQKYNEMIGGMKADVQRQIDADRQVWYDIQGWKEITNPKYGTTPTTPSGITPTTTPDKVLKDFVGILPTSAYGVEVGLVEGSIPKPFTSAGKPTTQLSQEWYQGLPMGIGAIPETINAFGMATVGQRAFATTKEIQTIPVVGEFINLIAPVERTTTIQEPAYSFFGANPKTGGAAYTGLFVTAEGKPSPTLEIATGESYEKGGMIYQPYTTYDLTKTVTPSTTMMTIEPSSAMTSYLGAERFVSERIPISSQMGEAGLRVASLAIPGFSATTTPGYVLETGKRVGASISGETISQVRLFEITKGRYAEFKEAPLASASSYAIGGMIGGGTRAVGELYGGVVRIPLAEKSIAEGGVYRKALQASDITSDVIIPYAFAGLYGFDIAQRGTKGFTEFGVPAAERIKSIGYQEAVPMTLGVMTGFRVPEIVYGTPRTTVTSMEAIDTTKIASGGLFETGRPTIDIAQIASGGQFRSTPFKGEVISERTTTREGGVFGEGGVAGKVKSTYNIVQEAMNYNPYQISQSQLAPRSILTEKGVYQTNREAVNMQFGQPLSTEFTLGLEMRGGAIVEKRIPKYAGGFESPYTIEPTAYPTAEPTRVPRTRVGKLEAFLSVLTITTAPSAGGFAEVGVPTIMQPKPLTMKQPREFAFSMPESVMMKSYAGVTTVAPTPTVMSYKNIKPMGVFAYPVTTLSREIVTPASRMQDMAGIGARSDVMASAKERVRSQEQMGARSRVSIDEMVKIGGGIVAVPLTGARAISTGSVYARSLELSRVTEGARNIATPTAINQFAAIVKTGEAEKTTTKPKAEKVAYPILPDFTGWGGGGGGGGGQRSAAFRETLRVGSVRETLFGVQPKVNKGRRR